MAETSAPRPVQQVYYDIMQGIVRPIPRHAPDPPGRVVELIASRAKWALEQMHLESAGQPTIPGGSAHQLDILRLLCRDFLASPLPDSSK